MRILFLYLTLLFPCLQNFAQDSIPAIYITAGAITTNFSEGTFRISTDTCTYKIDIRYRGATSLKYTKKSFAIKFKDEYGEKLNISLLGMREDNSWILDAMTIDKSRMRNRVSTDLWNDFSHPSYIMESKEKAHNGTHGQYVEVYLNDNYHGLFCLTEKIDRKQLGLKKFKDGEMRGVLYKSWMWEPICSYDDNFYNSRNDSSGVWRGWELSYPDIEDGEPGSWEPLANVIYHLTYTDEDTLIKEVPSLLDAPVWRDYTLMVDLLLAEDNIAKNQYIYYSDVTDSTSLLGIAPWDMDHAWGRDYKSSAISAMKTAALDNNWPMDLTAYYYGDKMSERYNELRYNYFSADSLKARFTKYYNILHKSGALQREKDKWNGIDGIELDFENEIEFVCRWIDKRLAFLDSKYNFVYDGIPNINNATDGNVRLYSVTGLYLGTYNRNVLKGLNIKPGIYIIQPGNKKIYLNPSR